MCLCVGSGAHDRRNLPRLVRQLRAEKRALMAAGGHNRFVPWLTVGAEGITTPPSTYDQLIHVFLNGASGFCYFADFHFTDMASYVAIAEVLALLVPYEDILLDGTLADAGVVSSSGCVVSAMQGVNGTVLLGVTPHSGTASVAFEYRGSEAATGPHVLVDVASGAVVQHVAGASVRVQTSLTRSAVYRFDKA